MSGKGSDVIVEDSTLIKAGPEAVFHFFDEMETHYLAWHPDHVRFRWERGRGVRRGNVFSFDERIAGKLLKKRVVFTHIVPNQHIEFAPVFWLMPLFLPRLLYRVAPELEGCRFTTEVHLRMGSLGQRAHRTELNAVREHMHAKRENLKRIVEAHVQALTLERWRRAPDHCITRYRWWL